MANSRKKFSKKRRLEWNIQRGWDGTEWKYKIEFNEINNHTPTHQMETAETECKLQSYFCVFMSCWLRFHAIDIAKLIEILYRRATCIHNTKILWIHPFSSCYLSFFFGAMTSMRWNARMWYMLNILLPSHGTFTKFKEKCGGCRSQNTQAAAAEKKKWNVDNSVNEMKTNWPFI